MVNKVWVLECDVGIIGVYRTAKLAMNDCDARLEWSQDKDGDWFGQSDYYDDLWRIAEYTVIEDGDSGIAPKKEYPPKPKPAEHPPGYIRK